MSLSEFCVALPSCIPRGKQIILASDFDETICSQYIYDAEQRLHIPQINPAIQEGFQTMQALPLITTSRSSEDPVVQNKIASLIAGRNVPIVCENGSVLFFPNNLHAPRLILATPEEQTALKEIRTTIDAVCSQFSSSQIDTFTRGNRLASIEIRVQQALNGKGTGDLHQWFSDIILPFVDTDHFTVVSSGSSISIQPKSISKALGIQKVLELLGIKSNPDTFIVGLGDAPNDKELLEIADLAIAVRFGAESFADIIINEGENATLVVLENL